MINISITFRPLRESAFAVAFHTFQPLLDVNLIILSSVFCYVVVS